MAQGRKPRLDNPTRVRAYVPEALVGELILLEPSLIDPIRGGFRYGAISDFIVALLRGYVEAKKRRQS